MTASCVIAQLALPIKGDHGHRSAVTIDEEPAIELESKNTIKVVGGTQIARSVPENLAQKLSQMIKKGYILKLVLKVIGEVGNT